MIFILYKHSKYINKHLHGHFERNGFLLQADDYFVYVKYEQFTLSGMIYDNSQVDRAHYDIAERLDQSEHFEKVFLVAKRQSIKNLHKNCQYNPYDNKQQKQPLISN